MQLQLRDRNNNCCHLCTSRHLLCADCACFQGTTVISIYIPSARWAGVRGTVLLALVINSLASRREAPRWTWHSARFDYGITDILTSHGPHCYRLRCRPYPKLAPVQERYQVNHLTPLIEK